MKKLLACTLLLIPALVWSAPSQPSGKAAAPKTAAKAAAKPAKATKSAKAAPKKTTVAKAAPKATKGERTDLTRRDWNKTVTTKARLAGGDTYKRVIAAWADVKAAHAEGLTPDQVIARFTK